MISQASFGRAKPESEVPLGLRLLAQVNEEENQELNHIEMMEEEDERDKEYSSSSSEEEGEEYVFTLKEANKKRRKLLRQEKQAKIKFEKLMQNHKKFLQNSNHKALESKMP